MDKDQLLRLLQAARLQRDVALARRIEAGKTADRVKVKEADHEVADCNEILRDIERALQGLDAGHAK